MNRYENNCDDDDDDDDVKRQNCITGQVERDEQQSESK